MDRGKLTLLFHTLKFLRFKQIYYRLFYFFRSKLFRRNYSEVTIMESPKVVWQDIIVGPTSYLKDNHFQFLNLAKKFEKKIDWNYNRYGKLWTYNLNYFDFLNQNKIEREEAISLMEDYAEKDDLLIDGLEPYPISLRGINWIKFLSKNKIVHAELNQKLFQAYLRLRDNLEYHLLGNHLLENGYSMLFAAYYFKNEDFYGIAYKILKEELKEQILNDGAHFELSPMYHQILLHRLLDCINLVMNNQWKNNELHSFLDKKAKKMLGWLKSVTYNNGNIPMVNDCAHGIAPSSKQLFDYAKYLRIPFHSVKLSESGYRKYQTDGYELFVDVGNIGPDYQPGHAHSDTFSFELCLNEVPFIVDVGTSTYEKNEKRQKERQTFSHNTVMINETDQSQVWDGFRVAKRAKITYLNENCDMVTAVHDGYMSFGVMHERSFFTAKNIVIHDKILANNKVRAQAFFHFHPSIKSVEINNRVVSFDQMKVSLSFEGNINNIEHQEYEHCVGFNRTVTAKKICVSFIEELKTTVSL